MSGEFIRLINGVEDEKKKERGNDGRPRPSHTPHTSLKWGQSELKQDPLRPVSDERGVARA